MKMKRWWWQKPVAIGILACLRAANVQGGTTDAVPGRRGRVREIYTTAFLLPDVLFNDIQTLVLERQRRR